MKALLTLVALVLLGCSSVLKPMDTYEHIRKTEVSLTIHEYKDYHSLRQALKAKGYEGTQGSSGFSRWYTTGNTCDIYVVKPISVLSQRHSDWGHELRHCVEGSFHQ